jgi:hypothetical protein
VAAVAVAVAVAVEGRASTHSAATVAAVFDSPEEPGGQTELQGIGAEGSTGTRCWD